MVTTNYIFSGYIYILASTQFNVLTVEGCVVKCPLGAGNLFNDERVEKDSYGFRSSLPLALISHQGVWMLPTQNILSHFSVV